MTKPQFCQIVLNKISDKFQKEIEAINAEKVQGFNIDVYGIISKDYPELINFYNQLRTIANTDGKKGSLSNKALKKLADLAGIEFSVNEDYQIITS
jgi:hypothetical protein